MRIDFNVRSHRNRKAQPHESPAVQELGHRPGRAARLLALAHHFEALLQAGAVKDFAELARLGHVSRARITQIMNLLDLAPVIQERLLGVRQDASCLNRITERDLRRILREVHWDRQLAIFETAAEAG